MYNIQVAVKTILQRRRERLRPVEEALTQSEACISALQAFKIGPLNNPDCPEELRVAIKNIPVDEALTEAQAITRTLQRAKARLSRDTVDIGVAGRARQGKSTLLQAFSGLSDKAIPTSDGGFCTAARSEIRNADKASARIRFHRPEHFMTKVVRPYFSELNLGNIPGSLDDFIRQPLPPLPEKATTTARNLYQVLKKCHQGIASVQNHLTGAETEIDLEDVRKYVTNVESGLPLHLTVERAVVETPFKHKDLPANLRLVDLPGLGELASNIAEELMRSVAEMTDIVLVVRRPDPKGDGWVDADTGALDIIEKAASGAMFSEWLAVVLNNVREPGKDNTHNVEAMRKTALNHDFHDASIWVADARDPVSVRENVVRPAMELLCRHPGALDRSFIDTARDAIRRLSERLVPALERLEETLSRAGGTEQHRDVIVESKTLDFISELRGNLRVMLGSLRPEAGDDQSQIAQELKRHFIRLGDEFDRVLSSDAPVAVLDYAPWDTVALSRKLKYRQSVDGVRDDAATDTRLALNAVIATRMEPLFANTVRQMKKELAERIAEIDPMPKLLSALRITSAALCDQFFRCMAERLPASASRLKAMFSRMDGFKFSYDTELLPYIREHLHVFDPDHEKIYRSSDGMGNFSLPEEMATTDYEEIAGHLRVALDSTALETLSRLAKESSEACRHWNRILFSVVEEFIDGIIWGDAIEREWALLIQERRRDLYADAYAEQDAASAFFSGWRERAQALRDATGNLSAALQ